MTEFTLNPISINRRAICHASWKLENKHLGANRRYLSREHAAAKWVAEEFLRLDRYVPKTEFTAKIAKNGELVTKEMLKGAKLWLDLISPMEPAKKKWVEQSNLQMFIRSISEKCNGTVDYFLFHKAAHKLYIYKYDFGFTPIVAERNLELIEYASGIMDSLAKNKDWNGLHEIEIEFNVVQPRDYVSKEGAHKQWTVCSIDLIKYFEALRLIEQRVVTATDYKYKISKECSHCPVRHLCPALQDAATMIVDLTAQEAPEGLGGVTLSTELRVLKNAQDMLKARITGLESQVEAMLFRGDSVPYFSLEAGRGSKQWTVPAEEVEVLGQVYGVEGLLKPQDVVTPLQAIDAGLPKEVVDQYTKVFKGKMKLTQTSTLESKTLFGGDK